MAPKRPKLVRQKNRMGSHAKSFALPQQNELVRVSLPLANSNKQQSARIDRV